MWPKETKILIVDDMMTMRKLVKKALGELGFSDITEADDGETAWPLVEASVKDGKPFQLIISDWNMPKLKGIDFLRKVRATETTKLIPFVLLTAEAEKSQIIEAVQAKVTGYVIKPFTTQALEERLKAAYAAAQKMK